MTISISNKQKALIHVAKSKVGMTEEAYRELLAGLGVTSSTQLTQPKFDALMRHFATLGFKSTAKYRRPPESKKRLMAKIAAIRADLDLPEAYVDAMCRRMFANAEGSPIASHRWLDTDQLHRLVAALTYHQKRKAAR